MGTIDKLSKLFYDTNKRVLQIEHKLSLLTKNNKPLPLKSFENKKITSTTNQNVKIVSPYHKEPKIKLITLLKTKVEYVYNVNQKINNYKSFKLEEKKDICSKILQINIALTIVIICIVVFSVLEMISKNQI